jgi:hypothetical protein
MFDPLAILIADHATKQQLLSARPEAPTRPERPPSQRRHAIRLLIVAALRRLADRLEPRCVSTSAPGA